MTSSLTTTALRLHSHSAPPVVEDVELPEPGADEVLVVLERAGVNPVDRYTAQGRVAPDGPLPRTLGSEAAGRVTDTTVLVTGEGLGRSRDGVWSSRAVVPKSAVVAVPSGVGLDEASAVGVAGLTAHGTVVTLAQVGPDDVVLVLGAGGGVGLAVVSLAAGLGATVVAQTGSAAKGDLLRELGAADVLVGDADAVAASGLRPTVVIDALGAGFASAAIGLLRPRGRYVVFGTSAGGATSLDLQTVYRGSLQLLGYGSTALPTDERRVALVQTLALLEQGRMRLPIARTVPLHEGAGIFDVLADRTLQGKVLLDLTA